MKRKSELDKKSWAVVNHTTLVNTNLTFGEAFALARACGTACCVITSTAAQRLKKR